MAGEIIMSITYGISIKPSNDPFITAAEEGIHLAASACIPGAFLVDLIPWLRWVPEWMPGAGFKRKAKEWRRYAEAMLNDPFEITKRDMVSVFTSKLIKYPLMIRFYFRARVLRHIPLFRKPC
jgi:hypothetical protein